MIMNPHYAAFIKRLCLLNKTFDSFKNIMRSADEHKSVKPSCTTLSVKKNYRNFCLGK